MAKQKAQRINDGIHILEVKNVGQTTDAPKSLETEEQIFPVGNCGGRGLGGRGLSSSGLGNVGDNGSSSRCGVNVVVDVLLRYEFMLTVVLWLSLLVLIQIVLALAH